MKADELPAAIDTQLEPLRHQDGQVEIDSELSYRSGDPVRVLVRRRGQRVDISDEGAAVDRAGRPHGWRALAEDVVAVEGFNLNGRGVIYVPVIVGRDIAGLAARLAATSRAVYLTLLESAE